MHWLLHIHINVELDSPPSPIRMALRFFIAMMLSEDFQQLLIKTIMYSRSSVIIFPGASPRIAYQHYLPMINSREPIRKLAVRPAPSLQPIHIQCRPVLIVPLLIKKRRTNWQLLQCTETGNHQPMHFHAWRLSAAAIRSDFMEYYSYKNRRLVQPTYNIYYTRQISCWQIFPLEHITWL